MKTKRIQFECLNCQKKYEKTASKWVKNCPTVCSRECRYAFLRKEATRSCEHCGKKFVKTQKLKRYFCSKICCYLSRVNKVKVKCLVCSAEFLLKPSCFKRYANHFCSQKCTHLFRITERYTLNCTLCKKTFSRRKREADKVTARNGKQFCSRKCSMLYGHGNPIVEMEFAKKLDELKIAYLRNDRKILKPLELDFYIDTIKCGIEINGPAHYRPVWGEKTLQAQRKRDAKKIKLCKEKGIRLFVIKIVDIPKKQYSSVFQHVLDQIKSLIWRENQR